MKEVSIYRRLLIIAGGVYFLWWIAVEALLPNSFNPLLSRLLVVTLIFGTFLMSFISQWARRHLSLLFTICLWTMTFHYYYLFYENKGGFDWIIGAYITVTGIYLCFFSSLALFMYSLYVVLLSLGLLLLIPPLKHSVFLPGLITIVFQANVAMLSKLKLLKTLEETKIKTQVMAESVRVRDEFISIASHELKTPLTSLKLQGQVMDKKIKSSDLQIPPIEKVAKFVTLVNRQTERLTRLVESMLDVSRISAGKMILDQKNIDLIVLTREVVDFLQIQDQNSEVSIAVKGSGALPVWADKYRIEQVIENLLTNAIKYGKRKPITITLESKDANAVLSIKDQGLGIAPQNIKRIFDRFERAVSSQNISGLGLGLYISRQIVEAHGGFILVESTIDTGSTFTVELPKSPPGLLRNS